MSLIHVHTPHPHAGTCSHWWLWRRFANTDRPPTPEPAVNVGTAPWRTCPMCWGQRQIWTPRLLGYTPVPCPWCLGVGDIPST